MHAQRIIFPAVGRAEIEDFDLRDPGENEIQVRNLANGICMFEVAVFRGTEPLTYFPGGRAGHEGIGQVVNVGAGVSHLKVGDYIPTQSYATHENLPAQRKRAFARPPLHPETWLTEPGACVITAAHSYEIAPGDRVLLLGAGYMGLLNVQLLAHYPLGALVVADIKRGNLDLAFKLGATETVLMDEEGEMRLAQLQCQPFDLVIEAAGVGATLATATKMVRTGGRLAIFAWHHQSASIDLGAWYMRGIKVLNCAPGIGTDSSLDSFERTQRLLETGIFDMKPLITHRHHYQDAQAAMELASSRPEGYIKGVFTFT